MTSALAGLVDLANGAFLGGRRLDRVQSLFEEDLVARLRDLVGNPFRPAGISPEWLACDGRQVTCLARAIYDERRFNELPYVADALEDAGCGDEVILRHLRGPGPHVRGCWVLDLLLGLA